MKYQTPAALESAIKDAADHSDLDTNRAIVLFWWDRFLARVFLSHRPEFVLKGGLSMLARMSSRYTRDIDLAAEDANIDVAEKHLIELASLNLNDYFSFRHVSSESTKQDDEYRLGRCVIFDVFIGSQKKGTIKVDLVVGCSPVGEPEKLVPPHRLNIKGLATTDYYLYPVVDTVADKVCATIATYPQQQFSSRTKDLVDLVIIALSVPLDATLLGSAIAREAYRRKLSDIAAFSIPDEWKKTPFKMSYRKLAAEAAIPEQYLDIAAAEECVQKLLNPVMNKAISSGTWNPKLLAWE